MSETATSQPAAYPPNVRSNERCPKCNGTLIEESGPPDFTIELACINCGNIIFDTTLDKERARQETTGPRRRREAILPNQGTQRPEEKAEKMRGYRQQERGYPKPVGPPKGHKKGHGSWTRKDRDKHPWDQ